MGGYYHEKIILSLPCLFTLYISKVRQPPNQHGRVSDRLPILKRRLYRSNHDCQIQSHRIFNATALFPMQSNTATTHHSNLQRDGLIHDEHHADVDHHHPTIPLLHEHSRDGEEAHGPSRNTGLLHLCAVTFLTVCGGPFGMEGAIRTGGPLMTFLALIVLPLFWSLSMALMTAELSTAMPHNMGYILWVQRAFGDSMGFLNGLASLFCNIVENSLYPALFIEYVRFMVDESFLTPQMILALQIGVIFLVFYINILGLDIVGFVSIIFTVLILTPFVVMLLFSVPDINPKDWFETIDNPDWAKFYPIVLWNLSGWDALGCIAGEVNDPKTTYPKAMSMTLGVVVATYMLPLVASIALSSADYESWGDGHFAELASIVGDWLGYWVAFTAILSTLGMFNVILATSARALHGMAELKMAPSIVGRLHPRYQTPYVSIAIFVGTIIIATLFLDFQALVELDMIYYAWSIILEFAAFFYLKISEPDMPRPYVVPGGLVGGAILSLPPILLSLAAMWLASWTAKLLAVVGMFAGYAAYVAGVAGYFDAAGAFLSTTFHPHDPHARLVHSDSDAESHVYAHHDDTELQTFPAAPPSPQQPQTAAVISSAPSTSSAPSASSAAVISSAQSPPSSTLTLATAISSPRPPAPAAILSSLPSTELS